MSAERSKYLALILRHKPEIVHLELMKDGWVQVTKLCNNTDFTLSELKEIVSTDKKGRYQFSEDKQFIRAVQGHSKQVNIEFKEFIPTKELYHGTADRFYSSILQEGIKKMSRQYVHLSSDIETAKLVGKRHGSVKIITIDAVKMFKDGYKFYIADNGVILTDIVPTQYFI
jgi:putative RNA 2'-phosphotransferase